MTADSHDKHFAVNSRAVALLMVEFARRHVKQNKKWGRIINMSADAAIRFAEAVSYGASKYALESYSRSAASELGRYGITVNIIAPGTDSNWIHIKGNGKKEKLNISLYAELDSQKI